MSVSPGETVISQGWLFMSRLTSISSPDRQYFYLQYAQSKQSIPQGQNR